MVVFDDIHWGEPAFLDLIEHVADWSRDVPILLLCMARPELLEKRPGWAGGKLNATSVLLEPLSDDECEELVANLIGQAPFALPLRERIAEAAEGNPLFVEEMIAMLIDDGLLSREEGSWRTTADLTQVAIPPSIQALLAARLDRLKSEERSAAECASVEGKVFHLRSSRRDDHPAARCDKPGPRNARAEGADPPRPPSAWRRARIPLPSPAHPGRGLRVASQAGALRPPRALRRLAGAENRERPGEYDEIVGHHLEQAYRLRMQLGIGDDASTGLAVHASARLAAAGHRALARGDVAAAANLLGRAVSLRGAESRNGSS